MQEGTVPLSLFNVFKVVLLLPRGRVITRFLQLSAHPWHQWRLFRNRIYGEPCPWPARSPLSTLCVKSWGMGVKLGRKWAGGGVSLRYCHQAWKSWDPRKSRFCFQRCFLMVRLLSLFVRWRKEGRKEYISFLLPLKVSSQGVKKSPVSSVSSFCPHSTQWDEKRMTASVSKQSSSRLEQKPLK